VANLESEKQSLLKLSHKDLLDAVVDIRKKRREAIINAARSKRTTKAKKPRKPTKTVEKMVDSLSLEEAEALLVRLQGEQ